MSLPQTVGDLAEKEGIVYRVIDTAIEARTGSQRNARRSRVVQLAILAVTMVATLASAPARPAAAADNNEWVWITTPDRSMCLSIDSRYDVLADMSLVAVRSCNFELTTYWRRFQVRGTAAEFRNFHSDKCLDIAAGARDTNVAAVQYRCWGGISHENVNQQWQKYNVRDGNEGLYRLYNEHSSMCLTRTGQTENSVVVQRGCAPNELANEWRVEPARWLD